MVNNESRRSQENGRFQATHGEGNSKLYNVWHNMLRRCYVPSTDSYHNYGAKGIVVCDEWKDDYTSFRDWSLSHGYKEGLSIERNDSKGNYYPENCRFATRKEQNNNKSNVVKITIDGVTKNMSEWSEIYGISFKTVSYRIRNGWDPTESVTTPVGGKRWNWREEAGLKSYSPTKNKLME